MRFLLQKLLRMFKVKKRFKFCSEGWQKARGGGLKTEWKMIGMKNCT